MLFLQYKYLLNKYKKNNNNNKSDKPSNSIKILKSKVRINRINKKCKIKNKENNNNQEKTPQNGKPRIIMEIYNFKENRMFKTYKTIKRTLRILSSKKCKKTHAQLKKHQ